MSTEYFEINSNYRNRNQYPEPSQFVVEISQSGTKNRFQAVDPVSLAAPRQIWIPFTPIAGQIAAWTSLTVGSSNSRSTMILSIPVANAASKVLNYYAGATIRFTMLMNEYERILEWRYLQTSGGNDTFQVTLVGIPTSNVVPGTPITIQDPTDFSDATRPIIFIPQGINSTNYYVDYIIYNQTQNEWLPIDYYSGITHLATLDTTNPISYGGAWLNTDTYILRKESPVERNLAIVAVPNQTTVVLAVGSSTVDQYYTGSFLRIQNNDIQSRRITNYVGLTRTATLERAFTVPLAPGNIYEILQFTNDQCYPFQYTGSMTSIREAVCYDVELLNLVLPNTILNTSSGSRAVYYPFVYVELTPLNNSERQAPNSIASNNPNARRMLFRALVFDTTNDINSPFIRIDGGGMVQRIKLIPNDSYLFSVYLPDGNLFSTEIRENYSPDLPNNLKQISALFALKRVSSNEKS